MAWITPIGSDPAQVDYRLGVGHGCVAEGVSDAQLDYHTDLRERPLIWVGKGLADLGIDAGTELTPEQFDKARALVNGYNPTTGEQLIVHKKAVPHEAKLALSPLVRMIEGIASEADVPIEQVLISARSRAAFARAQRAVAREGEAAVLRADHAGQLADAAGLDVDEVWGEGTFADTVSNLTRTLTHPDGTTEEVDNRLVVGNLAYDITLTLEGSFRAAYGVVDDQTRAELDSIYTDQAMKDFNWLENVAAYGMRGHHGDGKTATITNGNGFAGWAMFHRTARPVDGADVGDPHWHVHYTIANMTMGEDGKWSTIAAGGRDLMRHAPVLDKLLQASVRDVLTRRYGMQFRRSERTGRWEIAAVPDEAIRLFSKRGQGIEAALTEMGFSPEEASKAVRRVAASQTREGKNESTTTASDETLSEHWRHEAINAGLDPDQITRDGFGAGPRTGDAEYPPGPRPTLDELALVLQDVDAGLTAHARRFSRADALGAVADAVPSGLTHAEVEQLTDSVLEHAGFVQLVKPPEPQEGPKPTNGEREQLGAEHMANSALYTTRDVVAAEKIIIAAAQDNLDTHTRVRVSRTTAEMAASTIEAAGGFELSAEQRRELLRITTHGHSLDALIGGPGAGKTTLMDAVRAAYQAEGLVIAGAATQGVTAQNLQAESGIPSRTVAQWLYRIDNGPGLKGIDKLVLDEAAMTNDRDRARLYVAAAKSGTDILEIGDPKQLRGVGVGSSFGVVHAILEGGELVQNKRQSQADERAAIAAWRRGDYSEALTNWADRDRLVVTETGQEATAALLASWIDQRQGAPDAFTEQRGLLMVASTNEMVDRLNEGAQALRLVGGELGTGHVYNIAGGKTLALYEGDYVMVRVNERTPGEPDVLNGYRGVIDTVHDDGSLAVRWERNTSEGRVMESKVLGPEFVAKKGLTLGYAVTIHKSQGMTVGSDGATWDGPDGHRRGGAVLFSAAGADNPGSFVATSRHKLAMWMFLARKDVEGSQDAYLLGVPRNAWERTRRVITKLVDRAKATAINRNDTPVLVDLGLLEDPLNPKESAAAKPSGKLRATPEEIEQRRAFRAKKHAADVVRRANAESLLREEWGTHPAVESVTGGAAFRTLATVLDRFDKAGGNPRDLLRDIDPDDLVAPHVRDASRLTAFLVKEASIADPTTAPRGPRPMTKAQREARDEAAEQAQRTETANLLRQTWGTHPAVDLVIAGSAFGALAQNLTTAATAGHDPRAILLDIDPDVVVGTRIKNPSAFTAARIRTATNPPDPAGEQSQPAPQPRPEEAAPLPADAAARLDVLVPSYERTVERLIAQPVPVPTPAAPEPAQPTPQPAAHRRDAMWPSWLPTPPSPEPLAGRERAVATAIAADALRIRARIVELGRFAARDRPDWVEQLGPAPDGAAQRARYLAAITTIAAYREQYGVTGPDPLGSPPPDDQPAYLAAVRARDQVERPAAPGQPPTPPGQRSTGPARPGDTNRVPTRAEEARQRAARLVEQQRQAQQQRQQQAPHRPGPSQGPRIGY